MAQSSRSIDGNCSRSLMTWELRSSNRSSRVPNSARPFPVRHPTTQPSPSGLIPAALPNSAPSRNHSLTWDTRPLAARCQTASASAARRRARSLLRSSCSSGDPGCYGPHPLPATGSDPDATNASVRSVRSLPLKPAALPPQRFFRHNGQMKDIARESLCHDPIHGYIPFVSIVDDGETSERTLLDHPWVQRLRQIHQLQTAWWVYPTAEHTRFQHVVGAMHVASRAVETLYESLPTFAPMCPAAVMSSA